MNIIPLEALPNQRLGVLLDGSRYDLTFKRLGGAMAVTIYRDDAMIMLNVRCVAGTPLIPYKYLSRGNFIFLTENEELPDWRLFGETQTLVYLTAAEIEALL